jgi:hypothetical protein
MQLRLENLTEIKKGRRELLRIAESLIFLFGQFENKNIRNVK